LSRAFSWPAFRRIPFCTPGSCMLANLRAEVEIVRMLGAVYTKGDNSMKSGAVVAEADPLEFAPHAFLKWDMK
jgi:hypothetical protein